MRLLGIAIGTWNDQRVNTSIVSVTRLPLILLTGGVVPDDGKLCAMAAIGPKKLLVLEQSDDGDAKLYRCELGEATNVLGDDRKS